MGHFHLKIHVSKKYLKCILLLLNIAGIFIYKTDMIKILSRAFCSHFFIFFFCYSDSTTRIKPVLTVHRNCFLTLIPIFADLLGLQTPVIGQGC